MSKQVQKKIQLTVSEEEYARFDEVVNRAMRRWSELNLGMGIKFKGPVVIRRIIGLPQMKEEIDESVDMTKIVTDEDIRYFLGRDRGSIRAVAGKDEGTPAQEAGKKRVNGPKK